MRRVIWPNRPQALCGLVLYFLALSTETYGRKTPALGTLQKRNSVSNATGISLPGSSLGDAPSIISTNNGGLGQETKGKGGAVSSAKPGGLSSSLGGVEGVGVQIGGAVGGSTVPLGNLGMGISNPLLIGSSTGNGGGIEAGGSPSKADQFIPGLTRQVFKDIDGFKVKDLTASPKFPNSPDEEDAIAGFSVPSVPGESWGEKIFGYFKAPDDGDYTFYISSNAESELHVSTDQAKANLRKYASVGNREILQPGEYDKYPGQVSTPVRMTKNDFYFFEVLHKQLFGQSHLQVGVKFPNGTKSFPVPNDILFTRKDAATNAAGDTSVGGGATGGGGAGMGATGGGGGDAAVDPLAAAAKAGLQAGLQQGAQAGQDAGKKAGEQAGSEAGERAGLQAAAAALGITIDELQARKAQQEERKKYVLKVKVYSANFPCANPGGHVCKYALSILEDNTATLNPREEATVFILRKPALNGQISAFSLEMDAKRDFYLKKEFGKFVVDRFDASPGFGKTASFALEGKEDVLPASSAIKLADNVDDYLCHATASSTLLESKFSKDCTFHFVHPELDNNLQQRTCTDYCRKELQVAPKTDEEQATAVETLSLLNALAQKATIVASEKLAAANQQHIKALKETVSKVKSEASMLKYATEQAHSQLQAGMQGGVSVDSTHPGYGSISEAIKDNPMSQANKNGPEFEDHVSDDSHSWIGTDTAIGKKMIAVRFINHALNGTKIVSNLKPDGYALSTDRFKLKIIFKSGREPKVTFHGVDTTGAGHPVYLDGKESLTFTPTEHQDNYIDVEVKSGLAGRELHEVLKNEKHPQESDNTLTQKSITARKHESTEDKHQVPETKAFFSLGGEGDVVGNALKNHPSKSMSSGRHEISSLDVVEDRKRAFPAHPRLLVGSRIHDEEIPRTRQRRNACDCSIACQRHLPPLANRCNARCNNCLSSKKAVVSVKPKLVDSTLATETGRDYPRHIFQSFERQNLTLGNPKPGERKKYNLSMQNKNIEVNPHRRAIQSKQMDVRKRVAGITKSHSSTSSKKSKISGINIGHEKMPSRPSIAKAREAHARNLLKTEPMINGSKLEVENESLSGQPDEGQSFHIKLAITNEPIFPRQNLTNTSLGFEKMSARNEQVPANHEEKPYNPVASRHSPEFEMRKGVPRYSKKVEIKQRSSGHGRVDKEDHISKIKAKSDQHIIKKSKSAMVIRNAKHTSPPNSSLSLVNSTQSPGHHEHEVLSFIKVPESSLRKSTHVTAIPEKSMNASFTSPVLKANGTKNNESIAIEEGISRKSNVSDGKLNALNKTMSEGLKANEKGEAAVAEGEKGTLTATGAEVLTLNQTRRGNVTSSEAPSENSRDLEGTSRRLSSQVKETVSKVYSDPFTDTGTDALPERFGVKPKTEILYSDRYLDGMSDEMSPGDLVNAPLQDGSDWFGSSFDPDSPTKSDLSIRDPLTSRAAKQSAKPKERPTHSSNVLKDVVDEVQQQEWKQMGDIISGSMGNLKAKSQSESERLMLNDESTLNKLIAESEGSGNEDGLEKEFAGEVGQDEIGDENIEENIGRVVHGYKDDYEDTDDAFGGFEESQIRHGYVKPKEYDFIDDSQPGSSRKNIFNRISSTASENLVGNEDSKVPTPEESVDAIEQKLQILKDKHLLNRKEKIRETLAMIKKIEDEIDQLVKEDDSQEEPSSPIGVHAVEHMRGDGGVRASIHQQRTDPQSRREHAYNELVHPSITKTKLRAEEPSHARPNESKFSTAHAQTFISEHQKSPSNLQQAVRSKHKPTGSTQYNAFAFEAWPKEEALSQEATHLHHEPSSPSNLLVPKTIADMAEQDRIGRLKQAATLINLQKEEAQDDLKRLQDLTRNGLQELFSHAVAKQQKFIDDVTGPAADSAPSFDQVQTVPYPYQQYYPENQFLPGRIPMFMSFPSDSTSSLYGSPLALASPTMYESLVPVGVLNKKSDLLDAKAADHDTDEDGDDDDVPEVEDRDDYDER